MLEPKLGGIRRNAEGTRIAPRSRMSTKSKRRSERRATEKQSSTPGANLSERERTIAGQLMQAILSAFSFGAIEPAHRRRPVRT